MEYEKVLYKLTSKGQVQIWRVEVNGSTITRSYGLLDGKMQCKSEQIKVGKNIGRSNETTPEQQALAEAEAEYTKKLNKDYFIDIDHAKVQTDRLAKEGGYLPMLAQDFKKHAERHLRYPCYVQPKLDGCIFRTSKITTEDGVKTIEEIVKNKWKGRVLSYNETNKKYEYKEVINWFNNGTVNYKGWLDIIPEYGELIKCTPNHKVYTNNGWKMAQDLNEQSDKLLSTNSNHLRNCMIFGTLLGDSCLSFDTRENFSYRLIFGHSNFTLTQEKVNILNLNGNFQEMISGYGSKMLKFSGALTKTDFPWYEIYNKDLKRKIISAKVLKKYLIPQALSMLITDDGSINFNNGNKKTPRLSLSLHNFCDEQLEQFIIYFKDIWNCTPSIYTDKRVKSNGKFLTFSTKDTLYILNILKDYMINSMEYKYYFKDGKYMSKCIDESKFISFKKEKSKKRYGELTKYDLEVADNHNYIANGILIHNCRAISTKDDGIVKLWFRSGKEICTLPLINEQLTTFMRNGEIFDGELYIHGEDFNDFTGAIRANRNLHEQITDRIQYHIYDVPRIEDLTEQTAFMGRLADLIRRFEISDKMYNIRFVGTYYVSNFEESMEWYDKFIEQGYEGMMFRNQMMTYEQKRSYSLLKYKEFDEDEFPIIDYMEGKGTLVGHVGAFVLRTPEGEIFRAKMKGKTEYLKELFDNPEQFEGKPLTVKYFGKSKDGIPRFPVGKAVRFDK